MTELSSIIKDYMYTLRNNPQGTQEQYADKLSVLQAFAEKEQLQLEDFRPKIIEKFLEHVGTRKNPRTGEPIAATTLQSYAKVLKAFLSWVEREDAYEDKENRRVRPNLHKAVRMPKVEEKVLLIYSPEQISSMLKACDKFTDRMLQSRNKAIISVLAYTGIRVSELITLKVGHCFIDNGKAETHLKVHGKGNKWRYVPLGDKPATALRQYLKKYRKGAESDDVVFYTTNGAINYGTISKMVTTLLGDLSIEGVERIIHTFRHTFAVRYLEKGGDIYDLCRILGHCSVKVTEMYLKSYKVIEIRKEAISVIDKMAS